MRLTKVTLELSDSDWIFILDSLIDVRNNLVDFPRGDAVQHSQGIEQANRLIGLIHGRIAD